MTHEQKQDEEVDLNKLFDDGFNNAPEPVIVNAEDLTPDPVSEANTTAEDPVAEANTTAEEAAPSGGSEDSAPDNEAKLTPHEVQEQIYANRIRKLEGKLGEYNARILKQEKQLKELSGGNTNLSAEILREALKNGEKFQELKRLDPEQGSAIEEILSGLTDNIMKSLPKQETVDITKVRQEIMEEVQLLPLNQKYPDWREEVQTAAFNTWVGKQPKETQALVESANPYDAIALLDGFHGAMSGAQERSNALQEKNTNRLEQAIAPTKSTSVTPKSPEPTIDEMFDQGFTSG